MQMEGPMWQNIQFRTSFHRIKLPLLILAACAALAYESSKPEYSSQSTKQVAVNVALSISISSVFIYSILFQKHIKGQPLNFVVACAVNYIYCAYIAIFSIFLLQNDVKYPQQQGVDMLFTRITVAVLFLYAQTHWMICLFYQKPYEESMKLLDAILWITPSSSITQIEWLTSDPLVELYLLNSKKTKKLLLIFLTIVEIIFSGKMKYWILFKLDSNKDVRLLVSVMNIIQGYLIFLFLYFVFEQFMNRFRLREHDSQKWFGFVLNLNICYFISYCVFLSIQLNAKTTHINIYQCCMPILVITLIPLFASILSKRAILKLSRNRRFSYYELQILRRFSEQELQQRSGHEFQRVGGFKVMQKVVELNYNFICLFLMIMLVILSFVNLVSLLPREFQETPGNFIQNSFELAVSCMNCIGLALLTIYNQNTVRTNSHGVFGSLLILKYYTKIISYFTLFMVSFILGAYFINFFDANTTFHIGPLLAVITCGCIFKYVTSKINGEEEKFISALKSFKKNNPRI